MAWKLRVLLAWVAVALSMPVAAQVDPVRDDAGRRDSIDAPIASWRAAFRQAGEKEGLASFRKLLTEASARDEDDPTFMAFRATAEVMTAGRRWNPLAKLIGFRKWTKRLDRQVEIEPGNADIRLLRLAVRANAPSFLGYNKGIEEDCSVVGEALRSNFWSSDPSHVAVASTVLESVEACR